MFDSIPAEGTHVRLRNAALAPFAAFLFALAYFTFYPLFRRVPAALFWLVALVLIAGAVAGAVLLIRVIRREPVRGIAIPWLVAAILLELVCVWMFAGLVFPWL